ncbi:MAG: hypothetical protein ACP5NF_11870 [Thermoanaerobaculum sp.]
MGVENLEALLVQLVVRPMGPGEELELNREFCRVFNERRSLAVWRWKFEAHGLGTYVMVATNPAGKFLAHYAGVPVRFRTPVGERLAAQVADVFSVPEGREGLAAGKAYLEAMAAFFEMFCGPGKLALLFGFPSQRPLKLGKLTGRYSQIPDQPVLLCRCPAASLRPAELSRFSVHWGLAPSLFEQVWQNHQDRFAFATVRDAAYLRWRYLAHPAATYQALALLRAGEPLAWAVFRELPSSLAMVDWAGPPEVPVWRALLATAAERFGRRAHRTMEAWLAGDPSMTEVLRELGFTVEEHPAVRLAVRVFHPDMNPASVPGRFFVTWGDTDLI